MAERVVHSQSELGECIRVLEDKMMEFEVTTIPPCEILLHCNLTSEDGVDFELNATEAVFQRNPANEAFVAFLRELRFADMLYEISQRREDLLMTITVHNYVVRDEGDGDRCDYGKDIFLDIKRAPIG